MRFEDILQISPYALTRDDKEKMLTARLLELTEYHKKNCSKYQNILNIISYEKEKVGSYKDLPFLPVRLFKERELRSVSKEDIVKVMTSSGTTGQSVSKIYLDRVTSENQQKTMVKVVKDFIGSSRMPMIIVDCPSVVKDRNMFSARGAGILGFSIFGAKKIYALDDNMQLNINQLNEFLEKYKNQKILLFGFTFVIWQHFYKELVRLKGEGIRVDLSKAVLIHGGGWKRLINEAVNPEEFNTRLKDICGLNSIHDYYGMVEQTGCIYMQCECGHLHASIFSDVLIRNPKDFSVCAPGEKGIIQVVSTIPESYPGHSLLTEDEGIILGEDDCPCGRKGKYFKILGRLQNAEIRGCSDTYAVDHAKKEADKDAHTDGNVLNRISYLVGDKSILGNMQSVFTKEIFDTVITEFLNDVSKELLRSSVAKSFPDVISLGFWLRKAYMNNLKKKFGYTDNNIHFGRGVAFHIAPSNVPVNYAYSLFAGLLCGNANIVRVPSKDFPQVSIINNAIKKVLENYQEIRAYICLIRYGRDSSINDYLSSMCDVRIIWGGDRTITEIRKSPLLPRATEITFADRYSLAIIDSDVYMEMGDKRCVASDFYNDTYLTDQNACTSPRLVVWIGNHKNEAKEVFWKELHSLVEEKYHYQPIMGVDKISQSFLLATSEEDFGNIEMLSHRDNSLIRVRVTKLMPSLMDYKGNCGFFYEYDCENIMDIFEFCNNTHCQTIGIIGNKNLIKPLLFSGIKGIDHVAAVGHTMDFDLIWDGYNLVDRLTRTISI